MVKKLTIRNHKNIPDKEVNVPNVMLKLCESSKAALEIPADLSSNIDKYLWDYNDTDVNRKDNNK